ncbi:MAG: YbjQ family protein [Myxococcota bacterium]
MNEGLIRSSKGAVTGFQHPIPVVTTLVVPGYRNVSALGLVRGNAIRARNVGFDIMASFKTLVGGELKGYTQLLASTREQALDRMIEQAVSLGADGVVAVQFSTSTVLQGVAELMAYGTAVKMAPDESA